jgi:hypothetical protein
VSGPLRPDLVNASCSGLAALWMLSGLVEGGPSDPHNGLHSLNSIGIDRENSSLNSLAKVRDLHKNPPLDSGGAVTNFLSRASRQSR